MRIDLALRRVKSPAADRFARDSCATRKSPTRAPCQYLGAGLDIDGLGDAVAVEQPYADHADIRDIGRVCQRDRPGDVGSGVVLKLGLTSLTESSWRR
jgi:hypothetical protein